MQYCRLLAIILLLLAAAPGWAAPGRLSGVAEWRYGEHWADEGGRRVLDGRHFTQQYSVLYEKQGLFLDGRGGKYNLGLGYEWNAIDSELDGAEIDERPDKILYRGEVTFAPGGIPFSLHAYSHDLQRTTFTQEFESELFRSARGFDGGRRQGTIIDFVNGQRIQSGATLVFGIKNGSYLGKYRDILARYPKVLIDFREIRVDDPHGETPEKYVTRELAFVSLNKKDNWFHYRYLEHEDEINPDQDYSEKTFTLGTIDHRLQRHWINLTNWIKVSADANLTIGEQGEALGPDFNRYDLNLFATAKRTRFESSSFTTFTRRREPDRAETELEVPLFINGSIDRNTAYRFQFIGNREEDEFFGSFRSEEKVVYSALRLETGRQQRYIVAPQGRFEIKDATEGEGKAVEAGVEIFTNSRYRPTYDLFGSYLVRYFSGETALAPDIDFLEHELRARTERRLRDWRTGLQQTLSYGSGRYDRNASRYIRAASSETLRYTSETEQVRDGSVFHSTSKVYGEYLRSRLGNRFELIYDYLSDEDGSEDVWELTHFLRYDARRVRASLRNRLIQGAHDNYGDGSGLGGSALEEGSGAVGEADASFESEGRLDYLPNRHWETRVTARFRWDDAEGGDRTRWYAEEKSVYNFFQTGGLGRKLAQIGQEIEYERLGAGGEAEEAFLFTLLADYYPTRILFLGARATYRLDKPEDTDTYVVDLMSGLNFAKLQVSLNYSYGTRNASATLAEREEHLYELIVRKLF